MDLLDAIEKLEQSTDACQTAGRDCDFIERQVNFVQQKLRDLYERKRGTRTAIPGFPYYWVFSQYMRFIKEYPDGVTEAIIVTEISSQWKQKQEREDVNYKRNKFGPNKKPKIQNIEKRSDVLFANDRNQAQIIKYEKNRLELCIEQTQPNETVHMYLHQRFRLFVDYWNDTVQCSSNGLGMFAFQTGRDVVFTNAKLLERKEVDMMRPMNGETYEVKLTLLPTSFLTLRVNEDNALDRKLVADAKSLSQVDQFVGATRDPTECQVLILKAKVLDIGAVRPCQTPLYVHRQVILLGEVDQIDPLHPDDVTSSTRQLTQGLQLMVLWDDQVALSRLFHAGDTLMIFHPFVHVCDQHDTEILHILNEYSFQQRFSYYFEYGSATVLFSKSTRVSTTNDRTKTSAILEAQCEMEQPLSRLDDIKPGWHNFSLYAHVRSITVSHGIPLLAAFFSSYYESKINHPGTMNAKMLPPPPLDCTIVSRYNLVVVLEVYIAASKRLLTIEVTGENTLAALRLQPGQSVFMDGLVAIDILSEPICRYRERGLMPRTSASTTKADFAFPTTAYSSSSSVVVLCSDWESIFGKQSRFNNSSKLTVVNTTPGLINTVFDYSVALDSVASHALTMTEMTISGAGWLIPGDSLGVQSWTMDTICTKGQSTMYAHKSCLRAIDMISRKQQQQQPMSPPKWQCVFCHEVFFGLQDTVQTYRELAVNCQNGRSMTSPLLVLCQGDTVEALLGLSAEVYMQMPLADKRKTLERVMGTSFRFVLSRCAPRHILLQNIVSSPFRPCKLDTTVTINFRMDLVQPVNTLASAQELLVKLQNLM